MKKMNLKKLNLSASELLKKEALKTVLGGSNTCTLTCTTGTYPHLVGSDVCADMETQEHICYHFGGPTSDPVSCSCP